MKNALIAAVIGLTLGAALVGTSIYYAAEPSPTPAPPPPTTLPPPTPAPTPAPTTSDVIIVPPQSTNNPIR